jgi:hypothetical protein
MSHATNWEDVSTRFEEVITRFNAGETEALLSLFSDELMFSAPMLNGEHDRDGTWGLGKAAFRDYIDLYREKHGRMTMVDLFTAGNSVSVLIDDDRGNRIEFCNEIGEAGLITQVFAFHVSRPNGPRGIGLTSPGQEQTR